MARTGRFSRTFGLPRSRVAKRAGVAERTLQAWDAGEVSPTVELLARVKQALEEAGVQVSWDTLAHYYQEAR